MVLGLFVYEIEPLRPSLLLAAKWTAHLSAVPYRQNACPSLVFDYRRKRHMNELKKALPGGNSSSSAADWRELYQSALLEFDIGKLPECVDRARQAILDRSAEIIAESAEEEHRALDDALRALHVLDMEIKKRNEAA